MKLYEDLPKLCTMKGMNGPKAIKISPVSSFMVDHKDVWKCV